MCQFGKCGKCGNQWRLKHLTRDIPKNIKPAEANHTDDFKTTESSSNGLSIFLFFIIILALGAFQFKKEVIKRAPNEIVEETENKNPLVIRNIKAIESDESINLTLEIVNTSNIDIKTPKIIIADKFFAKANKEIVPANDFIYINTLLPDDLESPIKVSY